jgi:hypothetical protein
MGVRRVNGGESSLILKGIETVLSWCNESKINLITKQNEQPKQNEQVLFIRRFYAGSGHVWSM